MPLTKPRQALVTSKFWHELGRPSAWCTATAVDGSRWARLTEVLTIRPMSPGLTPASAIAFAPAIAAPSAKVVPVVPPAALVDAGQPLHHARAQADPAVDGGQPVVHLGGGDDHRGVDRADRQHRGVPESMDGIAAAYRNPSCSLGNSDPLTARSPGRVRRPSRMSDWRGYPMLTVIEPGPAENLTSEGYQQVTPGRFTTARAGSP